MPIDLQVFPTDGIGLVSPDSPAVALAQHDCRGSRLVLLSSDTWQSIG